MSQVNILSVEKLDVYITFEAICLYSHTVLFNDDLALEALSAVRCVHLLVESHHYEYVSCALSPINYRSNQGELALGLTLSYLKYDVILGSFDVICHIPNYDLSVD